LQASTYRHEWFGNVRRDILAGMVVAVALIPEAIGFSIIVGVDPRVGLYASFCIAIVMAFVGGRPGMISAATGSTALLMVGLYRGHGLSYLLATTILTGIIQIIFGQLKLARYLKFVPSSVMTGFVNALAILIFAAQLPQFKGATWLMYALVAAGIAIIYLFPRLTTAIPAALVAIIVLTAAAMMLGLHVRRLGDAGAIPSTLPFLNLPHVPFTLQTFSIIFPVAFAIAIVGLLESLLTAQIVDDLTMSRSNKHRETGGLGIANIVSGFFGGMAGCAMIGQSVINVTAGGRGRLSTFTAGGVLLILMVALNPLVIQVPMAALVAVMIVVSISTFDWSSFKALTVLPKTESIVMLATVGVTLMTNDLALGVLVGVLLSGLFFARKVSQSSRVVSVLSENSRVRTYHVYGQLFFVSTHDFVHAFDIHEDLDGVVIDLTHAHLWDSSAVGAIDKVALYYMRQGIKVTLVGMNEASADLIDRLAVHDKPGALERQIAL